MSERSDKRTHDQTSSNGRHRPDSHQPLIMPSLRTKRSEYTNDFTSVNQSTHTEKDSNRVKTKTSRGRTKRRENIHIVTPASRNLLKWLIPVGVVIVVLLTLFVAYLLDKSYAVELNGTSYDLRGSRTIAHLIDEGFVDPQPGDLLAVDGSIIKEHAGQRFEIKVNGETETDPERFLAEGDLVTIDDGQDLTEPCDERVEAIPYEVIEQGSGPLHVIEGTPRAGEVRIVKGQISGIEQRKEIRAPQHITYQKYFPDVGEDKVIALTLDDGPWLDSTDRVLDVLAKHEVKATFFTLGEFIEHKNFGKDLVRQAFDEGHQVCTHTYDHARGKGKSVDIGLMSPIMQIFEVVKGYETISTATGKESSRVVRMPGGNFGPNSQKILRPFIKAEIGWTIDSEDWRQPGVDTIVDQMLAVQPGGIILMHDGGGNRTQTIEALDKGIPALKEAGYRFITIDELLEYPRAQ